MASWRPEQERKDPLVEKALSSLRNEPGNRWTVDELASTVSTSRAVLARRFVDVLGVPPMTALREVRMARSAELLRSTDWGLAAIADEVGYDCEFSFSRAFFRTRGVRPGQYRRMTRAAAPLARAA